MARSQFILAQLSVGFSPGNRSYRVVYPPQLLQQGRELELNSITHLEDQSSWKQTLRYSKSSTLDRITVITTVTAPCGLLQVKYNT